MNTRLPLAWSSGALANPSFRWFYLGRTVSLFGSAMTPVALAFAVLAARHGQELLGYLLAAELLPNVLLVLLGGSLADRFRRDRLLVWAHVGQGCSQAAVAAVVLTGTNPYGLFPLAVLNGVLAAVTSPALRGIVPELVTPAHISQANALLNASKSAARIVGPATAGLLVATIGGGFGIAADAVTFFAAAACMAQVAIPSRPAGPVRSLVRSIKDGWQYFRRRRWIWSITGAWTVMNLIQMGAWQVLGPMIAQKSFGPAGWGLTLSVKAAGILAGSMVLLKIRFARPLRDGMAAAAGVGLPLVVLGCHLPLPVLTAAAGLAGIGSAITGVTWDTALQQGVPQDKLGQVLAFDEFGSYVGIPLGEILAVPLADRWGIYPVVTVGGVLFILVALSPLALRDVRRMTAQDIRSTMPG
ncbi:major facilitator superfamily MFS_1 [Sulfobacillus acidophilus TPY]|uniref:Major facilitator superfamily MFS_1 n=1 Tax=Sulfobacillus acidophilus (strain ATCC 700253 / DSM 10332 / NAL) TaxID=679936 RepID=G8TVM2_SULAD|nr:major facilitator superfamily MFS_1 [Sulfobacillus acidophilus TPY]AEW03661.1 major facilitator superfamily MFS_1 [Sulfobacillus acidophilus DSM 10332]